MRNVFLTISHVWDDQNARVFAPTILDDPGHPKFLPRILRGIGHPNL